MRVFTRFEVVSVDSVVDGGGYGNVLDQGVGVILGGYYAFRVVYVIDYVGVVVVGEFQDVDQVYLGFFKGSVVVIVSVFLGGISGLGYFFLGVVVILIL